MPTTMMPAPTYAAPAYAETVASELLGPIMASRDARYTFAAGLYGFETCHNFVLVPAGRPALYWLQSTEEPGLVFLLAEPGHFFPDYDVDVPAAELDALAGPGTRGDDFAAFAIVTLGNERGGATVNLQAPLVLHGPTRTGRQVVLGDGHQRVRVPIVIA